MIRMRIKNVIVASGPVPSAVVLRPAATDESDEYGDESVQVSSGDGDVPEDVPFDELPIGMGTSDAASVAQGIGGDERKRPMTHVLLDIVIKQLGGTLESVRILRMEGTTFFATIDVLDAYGTEHHIDSRPSDAIALAIRAEVPIFVSREVLERGGMPDFDAIAVDERRRELKRFRHFVDGLTPDDFRANDQR